MRVRGWMTYGGAMVLLAACGGSGGGNPFQPPPGPPVMADTVTIVDNSFGPSTVSISQGGTVTWEWSPANTMQHNVRWRAGPMPFPPVSDTQASGPPFEVTFNQAGTYEFVCSLHSGMQGAVFVQ